MCIESKQRRHEQQQNRQLQQQQQQQQLPQVQNRQHRSFMIRETLTKKTLTGFVPMYRSILLKQGI